MSMQNPKQMGPKYMPMYQRFMRFRVMPLCLLGCLLIMMLAGSLADGDIFYPIANDYPSQLDDYAPVYVIVEDKMIFILDIDPVK